MGPCRRRTRNTRKSSRKAAPYKKQLHDLKDEEASMVSTPNMSPAKSSSNSSKIDQKDPESIDMYSNTACSTPKAERFRIPEITTCPPAPKKRRIVRSCSLKRTPIAFYSPPDLELFFFFALPDVSV